MALEHKALPICIGGGAEQIVQALTEKGYAPASNRTEDIVTAIRSIPTSGVAYMRLELIATDAAGEYTIVRLIVGRTNIAATLRKNVSYPIAFTL